MLCVDTENRRVLSFTNKNPSPGQQPAFSTEAGRSIVPGRPHPPPRPCHSPVILGLHTTGKTHFRATYSPCLSCRDKTYQEESKLCCLYSGSYKDTAVRFLHSRKMSPNERQLQKFGTQWYRIIQITQFTIILMPDFTEKLRSREVR